MMVFDYMMMMITTRQSESRVCRVGTELIVDDDKNKVEEEEEGKDCKVADEQKEKACMTKNNHHNVVR